MSKSIRSTYFSRTSLGKLWKQYSQYGFWRIRTLQKHKRPATFRQLAPLLFVSSLVLLGLAGSFWRPARILLAAEAGLYLLTLAAGALDVGCRSGWMYSPIAPLVFVVLHFAYGLGSLWGGVRFCVLRGRGMKRPEQLQMSR